MKTYKTCSSMSPKKRQERYLCSTPDNATMLNIISDKPRTATQSTVYSYSPWGLRCEIYLNFKKQPLKCHQETEFLPAETTHKGQEIPQTTGLLMEHRPYATQRILMVMQEIHAANEGYPWISYTWNGVPFMTCWHVPISESNQLSAVPRSRAQHAPMRS